MKKKCRVPNYISVLCIFFRNMNEILIFLVMKFIKCPTIQAYAYKHTCVHTRESLLTFQLII